MINFDGECFISLKTVPEELLGYLDSLPLHTHHIIAVKGKIPFWRPIIFQLWLTSEDLG
jgi:hypothetical protein